LVQWCYGIWYHRLKLQELNKTREKRRVKRQREREREEEKGEEREERKF
jgi:hypothetical protein